MNVHGKKLCGVLDHLGGGDCLWPMPNVKIYAVGMLGGISIPDAVEEAINGIGGWNRECGIKLELSTNNKTANIVISTGSIDGPMNTLGWSELPCGFTPNRIRQIQQMYDIHEMWAVGENPPQNRVDAVRIFRHEIGHGIGISHIGDGNLMAPTYSVNIRSLQRGDIMEGRMRYGNPAVIPTTPTIPIPDLPPVTPPPGVPVPPASTPGLGDLAKLFPCIAQYGVEILVNMTPAERKNLVGMLLNLWRSLSPESQKLLRELPTLDQSQLAIASQKDANAIKEVDEFLKSLSTGK